ncbi:MAG TPA: pyridoxamine 5'-phosphate oxidase family protein [Candidatus Saccharimonadales bacterium]
MNIPQEKVDERIARGRELLITARHAAMATVNEDGTPHNTPFFLLLDEDLTHVYFGSHPLSVHSQNVIRTGEMFIVVYDIQERGGLYIKASGGHEMSGDELTTALAVHNARRAKEGKAPIGRSYYEGENPQRMFGANIVSIAVNVEERAADGRLMREYRHEISAKDLL